MLDPARLRVRAERQTGADRDDGRPLSPGEQSSPQRYASPSTLGGAVTLSTDHLVEAGQTFARLWDDHRLSEVESLYREDALFISPNPPTISPEFATTLTGRDEILRYLRACFG
jgi:hypothetical protein